MRIETDVLEVLSVAEVNGKALTLTGQLDRALYLKTNKVLEAAGGTWNKKARAHIFDYEAADRLDEILLTGEIEIPRDEFNFFPSPPAVVARLLEIAQIKPGMRVLEPSAGKGAIAYACATAGAVVDCYELMEANFAALCGDSRLGLVRRADFLEVSNIGLGFDRVVMNPPFAKQADIKHVRHAHTFLKPEGFLVSVMSAGVLYRDNRLTSEFRRFVEEHGGDIEELPEGSFKESGTMVNTVIVSIPA